MNYACPSDKPYITSKKILPPTPLSPEAKARREYIRSHIFSVDVNEATQKCKLIVTPKCGKENSTV